MARVFADKEGRVLAVYPDGAIVKDAPPPDGTTAVLEFDEATNPRAFGLVSAGGDPSELTLRDGQLAWLGVPIPIREDGEGAKERRVVALAFERLAGDEELRADDVRVILRVLARPTGLLPSSVVRDPAGVTRRNVVG